MIPFSFTGFEYQVIWDGRKAPPKPARGCAETICTTYLFNRLKNFSSENMSAELSIAEEVNFWQNFNFSICDRPELANVTELKALCAQGHQSSGVPTYVMTIIQIIYAIVCICWLVGNSLVIYVVLRFSKMHTVTNTYILHLAMADECFLVGIPFLIATMALREWPFGTTLCKVYFTTTSINQITSSLFLMVLSADRYVAVCHPISSPRFRTGLIAKIVSLSAWLLSALLMYRYFFTLLQYVWLLDTQLYLSHLLCLLGTFGC